MNINNFINTNSSLYVSTSKYSNIKNQSNIESAKEQQKNTDTNIINASKLNQTNKKSKIDSLYEQIQNIQEQIDNVKSSSSSKYSDPQAKNDKIQELQDQLNQIQKQISEEAKKETEKSHEKDETKESIIPTTQEEEQEQAQKVENKVMVNLVSADNALEAAKQPLSKANIISKSIDIGISKMLNNNKEAPSPADLMAQVSKMDKFLNYATKNLKVANSSVQQITDEYKKHTEDKKETDSENITQITDEQNNETDNTELKTSTHVDVVL